MNSVAIIAVTETSRETVTWSALRDRVAQCQAGMLAMGLHTGDRVAGYVANHTNALVAMLACTSLGAIWTAVSPDTGVAAVLDRMVQIEPTLLFTDNAVMYNGKIHPVLSKVKEMLQSLPTVKATIIFNTAPGVASVIESGPPQFGIPGVYLLRVHGVESISTQQASFRAITARPSRLYLVFLRDDRCSEMHRPWCHRDFDSAQKGAHLAGRYPSGRSALLFHDVHLDDVALACFGACFGCDTRAVRRLALSI